MFSTKCSKGSCGSNAIDVKLAIFLRVILANCGSNALTSGSFISEILTTGALLTLVFLAICSIRRTRIFICSSEVRAMLSKGNLK